MDFTIGDYNYRVISAGVNVYVRAVDKTKTTYQDIPATVTFGGETFLVMGGPHCFEDCTNMVTVPNISFSVGRGLTGGGHTMNDFFKGCTSLVSVNLKSICDGLPEDAEMSGMFEGCTSLTTVTMPTTGYRTVSHMFKGCTSLTSVDRIPVLVDTSPPPLTPEDEMDYDNMFEGCSALTSIPNFPSQFASYVTEASMIGCFKGCSSLVNPPSLPVLTRNMTECFYGCSSLASAPTIPSTVTRMNAAFWNCYALTQPPTIPTGVVNMNSAFANCSSLQTAPNIPNGVTNITYCFSGCSSLVHPPTIPASVTDMRTCFQNCSEMLEAPALPNGVRDISYCFSGCRKMTTPPPSIPSSVTNMHCCFQVCNALLSVPDIPYNVTDIGRCFYYNTSLSGTLIVHNTPTAWSEAFLGLNNDVYLSLSGNADRRVWESIANAFDHLYLAEANSIPTVTIDAIRTNSSGTPADDGQYALVTVEATLYEDTIPAGSNDVREIRFRIDDVASSPTWTETEQGLTHTFTAVCNLGDQAKHTFYAVVIDNAYNSSIPVTAILPSTEPAMDFYHGTYDNGVAFGKRATREGVIDSAWDLALDGSDVTDPSGNLKYLPMTGGTVTGSFGIESTTIDRDAAAPSSDQWGDNYGMLLDKDGELVGQLRMIDRNGGIMSFRLGVFTENASGTAVSNTIELRVAKDGTRSYYIQDPAAFRTAIGANSSGVWNASQIPTLATSKISGLGDTVTKDISSSVSCATSAYTSLGSITLPAGTWVIMAGINYASGAAGMRYISISTNSGTTGPSALEQRACTQYVRTDVATSIRLNVTRFTVLSGSEEFYLKAWQNSGSALNATGYIQAIRIA